MSKIWDNILPSCGAFFIDLSYCVIFKVAKSPCVLFFVNSETLHPASEEESAVDVSVAKLRPSKTVEVSVFILADIKLLIIVNKSTESIWFILFPRALIS